ncbi:Ff.00g000500.m01.CDS01 [Fusarium sp. VM40]|nr:Ff.00g000500.m01.CDS01 [Fusarium sp. VM40]
MSSPKGSEDLFPALESLSRLIVPHIKTVIFLALVVNQLPVLPDLQTILQSQFSSPLIFIVALYLGSVWTLPNGKENNKTFSWATLLGPFYAFRTVTEQVGTYIKVGSLVSLAYYLSIYYTFPLPFQPWAKYLFGGIAVAVSAIAYLFAPISKIYGPLRFCYLEHAQTYWQVLNWWSLTAILPLFSPTLLPVVIFGLISISVGTWMHVYFSYRDNLRTITWTVSENAARAKAAADEARDYGSMARKYEEQMINSAAEARRDVLLSKTIKASDFWDCGTRAWAALGEATAQGEDAIIKARRVIDAAIACEEAETSEKKKPDTYLRQSAESAHDRAMEAVALLRAAQAAVRGSENAAKQDAVARHSAELTAENTSSTAKSVSETVASIQDAERRASWAGGAAARRADEAIAMATNGEIEEAKKAVAASEAAFQVAEESSKAVREGMETTQRVLQEWLQSSWKGM